MYKLNWRLNMFPSFLSFRSLWKKRHTRRCMACWIVCHVTRWNVSPSSRCIITYHALSTIKSRWLFKIIVFGRDYWLHGNIISLFSQWVVHTFNELSSILFLQGMVKSESLPGGHNWPLFTVNFSDKPSIYIEVNI